MKEDFVNLSGERKEKFLELAKLGNLIPVYREILADLDTPVTAYMKLDEHPSFLLESVEGGEKWARYSFLGIRPSMIIRGYGRSVEIDEGGSKRVEETDDPIGLLRDLMSGFRPVEVKGLPRFFGGLVGYLGYDMVRFMEELPENNAQGIGMPDMYLMLTDTLLVFDSLRQTIKVVCNVHINGGNPAEAYEQAIGKIDDIIGRLRKPLAFEAGGIIRPEGLESPDESSFVSAFGPKKKYMQAVEMIKEYIRAGDIFQCVPSQRFERRSKVRPFDVYRALRVINPSPYMYFLDTGEGEIVGSSPEILVRLEGEDITLRPIAGTRPRGRNEAEDLALEGELKADPKEKAEHIMLVDLGRNDVGRVAEVGSVKVSDLMVVERYSHVMHMVSNVVGKLRKGLDSFDVLNACFPAGTVTGAPKIRAMEIINEIEPTSRGAYAGSVGYFGYSGNMDTCITIRTLIIKDGTVYAQAGGGVVADSIPESEYQETVNKAMSMMRAVEMAERGL
jgi:anthranilate synthase component 1